jgi:hypothetical protein
VGDDLVAVLHHGAVALLEDLGLQLGGRHLLVEGDLRGLARLALDRDGLKGVAVGGGAFVITTGGEAGEEHDWEEDGREATESSGHVEFTFCRGVQLQRRAAYPANLRSSCRRWVFTCRR